MKIAKFQIVGSGPYSQSRPYIKVKLEGEKEDDCENRTWRERVHADTDGRVFIPAMALKNALSEAAKYRAMKIAGQGSKTYTAKFESGVIVGEDMPIEPGFFKDKLECIRLFLPSDGRRGGGKRVWKNMPVFKNWTAQCEVVVIDEVIDEKVFKEHLAIAGKYIGIGYWRPSKNGQWGRFTYEGFSWT